MGFPQMRNPGLQPRASRDLLCPGGSPFPPTASHWRAQFLASRFNLSPWIAEDVAELCFGEGAND